MALTLPEPQIGSLHGLPISAWVDCFWPKVNTGMTIKAVAAEVGVSYRHSRLVLTGKHRYSTGTEAA